MSDFFRSTPKQEVPTREQIAQRAYELYESRGCEHGKDMEDWFAAESELRSPNAPVRPISASSPSNERSRSSSISASRRQSKTRPFENSNPPTPVNQQDRATDY